MFGGFGYVEFSLLQLHGVVGHTCSFHCTSSSHGLVVGFYTKV